MSDLNQLMYVPRIKHIMTLPYFPTYHEWLGHRLDCEWCTRSLARGDEIEGLCVLGQELATAVRWDIDRQHDIADQN